MTQPELLRSQANVNKLSAEVSVSLERETARLLDAGKIVGIVGAGE